MSSPAAIAATSPPSIPPPSQLRHTPCYLPLHSPHLHCARPPSATYHICNINITFVISHMQLLYRYVSHLHYICITSALHLYHICITSVSRLYHICDIATRQPPGSHQAATRQPSGSHQAATRQPPGSHQVVTRQPPGSHQAATRQPSHNLLYAVSATPSGEAAARRLLVSR